MAILSIEVDELVKDQLEEYSNNLGITLSEAIANLLKQSQQSRSEIKTYNTDHSDINPMDLKIKEAVEKRDQLHNKHKMLTINPETKEIISKESYLS